GTQGGKTSDAEGSASRVHRHPDSQTQRGDPRRTPRRREGPWLSVREDERRRARPSQSPPGRRQGRGPQAHRDQAPAREGPPDHASQRGAVLEAGGEGPRVERFGRPPPLESPLMQRILRVTGYALGLIVVALGAFLAYVAITGIPKYPPGKIERR